MPFRDIPCFPHTTTSDHRGIVVCGRLAGVPLIVLEGRCHLYEGYTLDDIALPIRALHACGASMLLVSNAGGGLHPRYQVGDVMVIEDHINLMGRRSVGLDLELATPRPARDRLPTYDSRLKQQALVAARFGNFVAHQGVYVAVSGPNYETRAEYRFLRRIGGDVVGMSTVPEVITARGLNMRVLGLSVVTNVACPDAPESVDPSHVADAAARSVPRVRHIVRHVLDQLAGREP